MTARLGIVVQRFGEDVVGGAEAHARMLATSLAARGAACTVLTTCARDADTWGNHYPPGTSRDGAVTVRRFRTVTPRFDHLRYGLQRAVGAVAGRRRWPLGQLFVRLQGPWAPALVQAIGGGGFDRLIFFTYLYYPTVEGAAAATRARVPFDLVPTTHDEPPLSFGVMARAFRLADRIALNTRAEQEILTRRVPDACPRQTVVGCGTDLPVRLPEQPERPACAIEGPYVLYLGRSKPGVEILGEAVRRLGSVTADGAPLRVVTAGAVELPGAINLGRVSAGDKWFLLSRAAAIIQPSRFESLGLTLIEAWQVGVPVLALADCAVLRDQVQESGGGLLFHDARGLVAAATRLFAEPGLRDHLAAAGGRYAERYSWDTICSFFLEPFDS